jgi:hypothetical protein
VFNAQELVKLTQKDANGNVYAKVLQIPGFQPMVELWVSAASAKAQAGYDFLTLAVLNSKNLVAFVLAAATGMTLYFRVPFPEGNTFLLIMALRSPTAFEVLKYSYTLFLFSTPYICWRNRTFRATRLDHQGRSLSGSAR